MFLEYGDFVRSLLLVHSTVGHGVVARRGTWYRPSRGSARP